MPPLTAAERIVPDSRRPLSRETLDGTATLQVMIGEAPAPPLELAAPCPAVVALSEDHALLQALTVAVIERIAVVTCPSADRFVDQLVANGAEIALIDAATAPNPLDVFLLALRRQFPQLQLVVVGPAPLQSELSTQIADGTIFRFAHKPASPQRLKMLLFSALRQRETLATDLAFAPGADPLRTQARGPARARWRSAAMLTLLVAAAMTVGWLASAYLSRHLFH